MSRTRILAVAAMALALAVARCAPAEPEPEPLPEPPVPEEAAMESRLVASLQAESAGDSVHLTLQVTNVSAQPLELTFPTGQTYEFEVLQEGRPVWRWSEDMMFTQAVRQESIAPEATMMYEATWVPPPGAAGEFTARGYLTAQEQRAEQETRFRLR